MVVSPIFFVNANILNRKKVKLLFTRNFGISICRFFIFFFFEYLILKLIFSEWWWYSRMNRISITHTHTHNQVYLIYLYVKPFSWISKKKDWLKCCFLFMEKRGDIVFSNKVDSVAEYSMKIFFSPSLFVKYRRKKVYHHLLFKYLGFSIFNSNAIIFSLLRFFFLVLSLYTTSSFSFCFWLFYLVCFVQTIVVVWILVFFSRACYWLF